MYCSSDLPEHRARELLNLVNMARRCARLPNTREHERRAWELEADRAWEKAQAVLHHLSAADPAAREVLAAASGVAAGMAEAGDGRLRPE